MDATCSSETTVDLQQITQHYIREDRTLQSAYEYDYNTRKLITITALEMYGLPDSKLLPNAISVEIMKLCLILTHSITRGQCVS
jgi:hypothetical protein